MGKELGFADRLGIITELVIRKEIRQPFGILAGVAAFIYDKEKEFACDE